MCILIDGSLEEASESSGPYIAHTIQNKKNVGVDTVTVCGDINNEPPPIPHPFASGAFPVNSSLEHPCRHFQVPPPPPGDRRRIGPRRKSLEFFLKGFIHVCTQQFTFYPDTVVIYLLTNDMVNVRHLSVPVSYHEILIY